MKVKRGQVWLAELSYCPDNPAFITVIEISYVNDSATWFRDLRAEDCFIVSRSDRMNLFKLISKVLG